jgi:hypothetical protein
MPATPVQLENLPIAGALKGLKVLLMSYHGQKPLGPEVHPPLVEWVKHGGVLVFCDDDTDPYARVREWWNADGRNHATPRGHLFEALGLTNDSFSKVDPDGFARVGRGGIFWLRENPARLAAGADGDERLCQEVRRAASHAGARWRESAHLVLRRGPYVAAAGLDESIEGPAKVLHGRYVNLFDPELAVRQDPAVQAGERLFLLDLGALRARSAQVLAGSAKVLPGDARNGRLLLTVEGVARTPGIVLLRLPRAPREVILDGRKLETVRFSAEDRLAWIRFENESRPRELSVIY